MKSLRGTVWTSFLPINKFAERVAKSAGRMSAKRLLPIARAAGYEGSARNFRRLVAEAKALWRIEHHPGPPSGGVVAG